MRAVALSTRLNRFAADVRSRTEAEPVNDNGTLYGIN